MGQSSSRNGSGSSNPSTPRLSLSALTPRKGKPTRVFCGIVHIQLDEADLPLKGRWFACVSLGQQTFRTATSSYTDKPTWKSEIKIALEEKGPRIARVSVFEASTLSKSNLLCYCEMDLSHSLDSEKISKSKRYDLYDPSTKSKIIGKVTLGYSAEDRYETEKSFAQRLLSLMDEDENGELSVNEFREMIKAFGNKVSMRQIEELFLKADLNGDGRVSLEELAHLLAKFQEKQGLMHNCPVCGEKLGQSKSVNDVIHISLCFDEGTGYQHMTGGFLTEQQASNGWMFKLSEWCHMSSYNIGLKEGSNSHILVFDRRTQRLDEEIIDNKIVLAMRAIYQSRLGLKLVDKGTSELLANLSKNQGIKMSSPESAKEIPAFIEFFKDRINTDEFKDPVESYKTFNEFFIRELKPGVRPIEYEGRDHVAVCAADCRLMVFNSVDDAKRFWIKGRKFSLRGLLADENVAQEFEGGSLAIFRLAPQDYHRFHSPVSGTLGEGRLVDGNLFTVNPIAVNSKICDVFTENKRNVTLIETKEFKKVAFISVGATMVGSITFTKKKGDKIKKGDELGYFSFGGSTVICVFQKDTIDFDEDLVANSERSLETLVFMGMSLGVSTAMPPEELQKTTRPTVRNSVVGLQNEIAKKGIKASKSFNAKGTNLGEIDEDDEE